MKDMFEEDQGAHEGRHRPRAEPGSILPNDEDIRQIEALIANNSLGRRLTGLVQSVADFVRQALNYVVLWSIGFAAKLVEKTREKIVFVANGIWTPRRE